MSIIYEKKDKVAYLTLNRPEAMNAIDREMFQGIQSVIADFRDDDNARVMLITGAGDRAFSTGVDMKSTMSELQGGVIELIRTRWFEGVYKPVVTAINGFCFAGALEMVLYTDIRIASENAVFGLTEAKWGVSPCDGAITKLTRQLSWCHVMELFAIADPITAQDAYRMGLINKIVPPPDLMPTAERIAHRIADNAPLAVRNIKEVASRALSIPVEEALVLEHCMGSRIMASEDAQEGPRAFAEKRKPQYKGR